MVYLNYDEDDLSYVWHLHKKKQRGEGNVRQQ